MRQNIIRYLKAIQTGGVFKSRFGDYSSKTKNQMHKPLLWWLPMYKMVKFSDDKLSRL